MTITATDNNSLRHLLAPTSIAIVGASDRRQHSSFVFNNLTEREYAGDIYLVNPNRAEVFGRPCFPSVSALPRVPDLALMVVGRDPTLELLKECAQVGVRAAIVNADGYSESRDPGGRIAQDELVAVAREGGIALCGPNCLGLINRRLNAAPFSAPIDAPLIEGGLCIISQSGGHSCSFVMSAYERNIGVSYVISTGNEAVLTTADYLDFLLSDSTVDAFCLFLESIRNPKHFLEVAARAAALGKPIFAVKVGRSEEARAAALAHTGALVGDDLAIDALFERGDIIRAKSIDDVLDKCVLMTQLPRDLWPRGRKLAVFTMGGGSAGLIADLGAEFGLTIPPLDPTLQSELEELSPRTVTVKNPIDLPGAYFAESPELPSAFVGGCAARDYDVTVIPSLLTPATLEFWGSLEAIQKEYRKPIIIATPSASPLPDYARDFMKENSIALVAGLDSCVAAIAASVQWHENLPRMRPHERRFSGLREALGSAEIASAKPSASATALDYASCMTLLESFGLPTVSATIVQTLADAAAFAEQNGYPIALKIASGAAHKSDVGGVMLDLETFSEIEAAWAKLVKVSGAQGEERPVIVAQAMVSGGVELIIGASRREREFPPCVLVGLGGIWVEVLRDVSVRLAPVDHADAIEMLSELRGFPILRGTRGIAPSNVNAIADLVVRVSELILDIPEVTELDINPAIVTGDSLSIVDALVVVGG